MPILDMRAATFWERKALVPPISVTLDHGERSGLVFANGFAAGIAARLAAGIVKCSSGIVFIEGFDPKIQPVQAKRFVGFVPHDRVPMPADTRAYFAYRAALWEIDAHRALERGEALLKRFDGLPLDRSLALAGALLHDPQLVVLDRPSQSLREAAEDSAPNAALIAVYGPDESPARWPHPGFEVREAVR